MRGIASEGATIAPGLPSISVLIPARNAEATIDVALASVRAQSLPDWEAVVVDDGSTDETADRVRRWTSRDARFRLECRPARGIVPTLNEGLGLCHADLIARFDADDLMHRHRLERQAAWLRDRPRTAGVGALVRCFPRKTMRDGMRRYEAWQSSVVTAPGIAAERFIESPLVHPSVTLRRSALLSVGGWRDEGWAEDWDLWLRLLERGDVLEKVPVVLHFWRDDPRRLTRTDDRYSEEALVRLRARYLQRGPLKNRSAVIWGAGPIGKALLKALDRERAEVTGFIDVDPRKIGQNVHGRRVHAPDWLMRESSERTRPEILLAAVGAPGAREDIRRAATAAGFHEGKDFFACA